MAPLSLESARRPRFRRQSGGRRTVAAASQTADLLAGLRVDTARMRATLDTAVGIDAEQRSMADLVGAAPSADYRGAADEIVDATLALARAYLKETA